MRNRHSQSLNSKWIQQALALCDDSFGFFKLVRSPSTEEDRRLVQKAHVRAAPDLEATDPSIRPVPATRVKSAEGVRFPSSARGRDGADGDGSVAGFWAY